MSPTKGRSKCCGNAAPSFPSAAGSTGAAPEHERCAVAVGIHDVGRAVAVEIARERIGAATDGGGFHRIRERAVTATDMQLGRDGAVLAHADGEHVDRRITVEIGRDEMQRGDTGGHDVRTAETSVVADAGRLVVVVGTGGGVGSAGDRAEHCEEQAGHVQRSCVAGALAPLRHSRPLCSRPS